jgi:hypothetical protein
LESISPSICASSAGHFVLLQRGADLVTDFGLKRAQASFDLALLLSRPFDLALIAVEDGQWDAEEEAERTALACQPLLPPILRPKLYSSLRCASCKRISACDHPSTSSRHWLL